MTRSAIVGITLSVSVLFAQGEAVEGLVPRDGFALHYTALGTGRPLLLLSGGPGFDVGYMQPVASELSKQYRCILLEQRGTGRSKLANISPENMSLRLVVEDVDALRKQLRLEKIDILGHSWGGMLAMAYAAAHPENAGSLVLVGSGGMTMEFATAFSDNLQTRMWPVDQEARAKVAEVRKTNPQKAAEAGILAILPGYFYSRDAAEKFRQAFPPGSYHGDVGLILGPDLVKNLDLRETLRAFSGPALIIQGHQDIIPESNAYEIHSTVKNSRIVFLDKCGHFPWLEQPQQFYKEVRTFLDNR